MVEDIITKQKIEKYLKITAKAIKKVKIIVPKGTHLERTAEDMLDMAQRYHKDSIHFKSKGDFINAFAAVNYAHGWLDAGARIGVFDVDHDSKLFTVD
ncbi:DUF357 domain-containing protein [Candidatus Woesearchaeota archaeon]|nr:DUF357 domain-containing protein [Candidatus Woesearchaeota archaeon]